MTKRKPKTLISRDDASRKLIAAGYAVQLRLFIDDVRLVVLSSSGRTITFKPEKLVTENGDTLLIDGGYSLAKVEAAMRRSARVRGIGMGAASACHIAARM